MCARVWAIGSVAMWVTLLFGWMSAGGQERPYFVTYSHALEEPGNLELAFKTVGGAPAGSGGFGSATLEVEYGRRDGGRRSCT